MQGSCVEMKKRKLSLKNVKTNKNGSVENVDVHFKSSILVPKSDLIKVDTVDLTGEDIHEKLSDKSQENASVSIVTNAGLLKIRALIEQFRDDIPQPLCPLPAYQGPPQVFTAATTETTPTHVSPLPPHLCLSTLRMRNLISAARRNMMETAAQCVNVTTDEDTRTSRHSDVTKLSSTDTNTSLPRHWCIDKPPISDTNTSVNETGFSKYVIPDPVNHRTTHPVTNRAASVHTFTPYTADLRNVPKPPTSEIGKSHSNRMTGTNYPKADKPSTVNRNSQKLCSQEDIQEAVVGTNIGTAVRTCTSNQTLKRPAERRTRDEAEECSRNFGGASKSCADSVGGTQQDLLTNCPLCSEEFPRGMDQIAIDHHIAKCVAAADEETTW